MSLRIQGGILAGAIACCVPMGLYFEGVFPVGYRDPVGIPTDCAGETEGAKVGVQRYTMEQCIARYPPRLRRTWDQLDSCMDGDVTMYQAAAIISWADNVGIRAACGSTLARMMRAGAPADMWCPQLLRWNKATKLGMTITLPGLTKRRAAETEMCLGRDWQTVIAGVGK